MNVFEMMKQEDIKEAYIAHRKAHNDDNFEMQMIENYLRSDACPKDIERLENHDYYISIPTKKAVPKANTDRKRIVYLFKNNEKSLFRLLAYCLHKYEHKFSDGLYSFRLNKSGNDYLKYLKTGVMKHNYAVKMDISSYGHSIDIERLIKKLEVIIDDDNDLLDFFKWLLRRKQFYWRKELMSGDTSALPGIPFHNFFTNVYLADFDDCFYDKCLSYCRYADDIIMFIDTEEKAKALLEESVAFVEKEGLKANKNKTVIYKPGDLIEFLGLSFEKDVVDIAPSSIAKLKRKMRIRAKRTAKNIDIYHLDKVEMVKKMIEYNRRTFMGRNNAVKEINWCRWAFPLINRSDSLHSLDLYQQLCIRFVMTGKWSDSGYRLKYDELKKLGYNSLVRYYYQTKDEHYKQVHEADD